MRRCVCILHRANPLTPLPPFESGIRTKRILIRRRCSWSSPRGWSKRGCSVRLNAIGWDGTCKVAKQRSPDGTRSKGMTTVNRVSTASSHGCSPISSPPLSLVLGGSIPVTYSADSYAVRGECVEPRTASRSRASALRQAQGERGSSRRRNYVQERLVPLT